MPPGRKEAFPWRLHIGNFQKPFPISHSKRLKVKLLGLLDYRGKPQSKSTPILIKSQGENYQVFRPILLISVRNVAF
jgi:hypothetical protein